MGAGTYSYHVCSGPEMNEKERQGEIEETDEWGLEDKLHRLSDTKGAGKQRDKDRVSRRIK